MASESITQNATLRRSAIEQIGWISRLLHNGLTLCYFGRFGARYMIHDGRTTSLQSLARLVVDDGFFRTKQIPIELTHLGKILLLLRPSSAMEIGTWQGGTLFFLTRLASPRATIISVDLPGGQPDGGGYNRCRAWLYRRMARRGQRLYTLTGDSHSNEMVERVKSALRGEPLDYLFIDGDHSYAGVKQDFELFGPLVRKGGLIAFHDIAEHPPETGCEVSRFWSQVKSQYRHAEFFADPRQGWAGIGLLYVD